MVVDDGSTDNTKVVVGQFESARVPVRYIYQANSGGPAKPRNVGIAAAEGDYIFIFDSDDLMLPGKITAQVRALDANRDAVAAFTQFQSISEDGVVTASRYLEDYDTLWNLLPDGAETVEQQIPSGAMFGGLLRANYVGTSSVALRASIVKGRYFFDESMSNSDDRLMWFRLARDFPWVFLGSPYHQYRQRKQSISFRNFDRRARSLINGLVTARKMCTTNGERKLIDAQVSAVLVNLSRSQRMEKNFSAALKSAIRAVRYEVSAGAVKVLLAIPWAFARSLLGKR